MGYTQKLSKQAGRRCFRAPRALEAFYTPHTEPHA